MNLFKSLLIIFFLFSSVLAWGQKDDAKHHVETAKDQVTEAKHEILEAAQQISKAEQLLDKEHTPSQEGFWGRWFGKGKEAVHEVKNEEMPSTTEQLKHQYERAKEKGQELKDQVQQKLHEGKDYIEETIESKAQKVPQVQQQAQSNVEKVKEKLSNLFHGSTEQVKEKEEPLKDKVKETATEYSQQAKDKLSQTQSTAQIVKDKITDFFGGSEQKNENEQGNEQIGQIQSVMDTIIRAKEDIENRMKNLGSGKESFFGGRTREEILLEQVQSTLYQTKKDMNIRIQQLNQLLSQCKHETPSTFQSLKESVSKYINDFSNQMNTLTQNIESGVLAPFQRWSLPKNKYLIQACKYLPGLTISYVNDNGDEVLDVNGENVTDSFDQLKALNEFRQEFNLPQAESIQNVSVFLHQLKQPRVLVKVINAVEDVQYRYQYDNGKESWNVSSTATESESPTQEAAILNIFRLAFGIKPKQTPSAFHIPKRRDEL